MQKKQMLFKTKGMNRDLSVSAFNPEFSFENRNLRLSTNESNTLLSWVNEKGTKEITSITIDTTPWKGASEQHTIENTISGTPLGTAVINHQLVVFTKDAIRDRIYVLTYNKGTNAVNGSCLFSGNLNFSTEHPIECLVSYEAEDIQKVYWVDGLNQPRIINIKASNAKVKTWNTNPDTLATFFDFNPAISLYGNINVERDNTTGTFAPGVIQYAFCYLNMYSQQSNIVDISPLYYISPSDRGASPEERVTCSFGITISAKEIDTNYNYVRIFSIQRTSIDSTPIVKHLIDISTSEFSESAGDTLKMYYKDTGVGGETMDSTALLFMSKRPMSAETIADKDNTLFLGNITDLTEPTDDIQTYFDSIRGVEGKKIVMTFQNGQEEKTITLEDSTGTIYKNTFELKKSQQEISTFKGGEEYRFGFQLKDKYGVWSNPIFIDDYTNNVYPKIENNGDTYNCQLVFAEANIDFTNIGVDITGKYTEIRPVIVHPTEADRKVLYQGVLNPTVFQASNRKNLTGLGSQSSWFFRPMTNEDIDDSLYGNFATFSHYASLPWHNTKQLDPNNMPENSPYPLPSNPEGVGVWGGQTLDVVDNADKKVEIFGAAKLFDNAYDPSTTPDLSEVTTQFFVDQSIVTLNSPDIELGENLPQDLPEDVKLRIVGAVPITSNASYTYVESSNKEAVITKEITPNYTHNNISKSGGQRLISDFLWQDSLIRNIGYREVGEALDTFDDFDERVSYNGMYDCNHRTNKFLVNPWHATRPLNNDWEENRTMLQKKVMVTQLFSHFSEYFGDLASDESYNRFKKYENITAKLYSSINKNTIILPKQNAYSEQKTYGGYIDTAILNNNKLDTLIDYYMPNGFSHIYTTPLGNFDTEFDTREKNIQNYVASQQWTRPDGRPNNLISMKYNSANHAVIAFNADNSEERFPPVPILPHLSLYDSGNVNYYDTTAGSEHLFITFWGDIMCFKQDKVDYYRLQNDPMFSEYAFLWLGELYRDTTNGFGGKSLSAIKANTWLIGGESVPISAGDTSATLKWTNGDTFFQRYDCLKTYPITDEDVNQNSEILSFMCETRINLDGRYDKLRGVSRSILPLIDSTNINKINPIYSQKNNYFTSRVFQQEDIVSQHYPNYIAYSMTKEPGSDVDTYTDISLASVLELDGDKGEISALRKLNNHLFAFQDSGISRVMFNDNVQVQSTEGVPIQIANSGKVLGKDYISNTVGCSNKWSIVQTPNGLYFMDSNDKSIYLFNGQLSNISAAYGFNTWCKQHIPAPTKENKWTPVGFNNFVGHYDRQNQEVLYVNKEEALALSEKLGAFTSFYDYGESPFFENLDDVGLWIKYDPKDGGECRLWRHQAGNYGSFFGEKKPYWMTLVANPEPQVSKIFTNLEFRAYCDMQNEGDNQLPFDYLETWNEYQHGFAKLSQKDGNDAYRHHINSGTDSGTANLAKKFRIWRCDIPRDNADPITDAGLCINRFNRHPNDRMRNPWLYLKLFHQEAGHNQHLDRTEIHDVMMTYFE